MVLGKGVYLFDWSFVHTRDRLDCRLSTRCGDLRSIREFDFLVGRCCVGTVGAYEFRIHDPANTRRGPPVQGHRCSLCRCPAAK